MMILLGRSSVALLFASSGPATISRLVISIVVDAVERFAIGAFSHVRKKVEKVAHPLLTHRYSAGTIIRKLWRFGIGAALNHSSPCLMLRPPAANFCSSVSEPRIVGTGLSVKASAAFRLSSIKVCRAGCYFTSAIAHAIPSESVPLSWRWANDSQPAEASSDEIGMLILSQGWILP